MDGDKQLGAQHLALVVASGDKTSLKQGSRVPIVTGMYDQEKQGANSQVQYQDVGLNIEVSLKGYLDGLSLRTKIEQTSVADDKSGVGPQDPVVKQTVFEGLSTLMQGKPLALGSFDVPGSTRKQTIEVVAELVK
jgi:type II secretory pathway component GspD/PulD (secretin)